MLDASFFARPTLTVARDLIGCVVRVRARDGEAAGRIVEAEAYLGQDDPASHAGRGRTPRSEIMFGPPAVAYVYLIYGMHHCLNFVTGAEGTAGAVLIRALEPVEGRELMARRRSLDPQRCRDRDLTAGPGKLCRALGIDLGWNGRELGPGVPGLEVERVAGRGPKIAATARIGIRKAAERPFRFVAVGSPCLSG